MCRGGRPFFPKSAAEKTNFVPKTNKLAARPRKAQHTNFWGGVFFPTTAVGSRSNFFLLLDLFFFFKIFYPKAEVECWMRLEGGQQRPAAAQRLRACAAAVVHGALAAVCRR